MTTHLFGRRRTPWLHVRARHARCLIAIITPVEPYRSAVSFAGRCDVIIQTDSFCTVLRTFCAVTFRKRLQTQRCPPRNFRHYLAFFAILLKLLGMSHAQDHGRPAYLDRPAAAQQQTRRVICSADVSYLLYIFNDFCQTNYLKIYQTDLYQIGRIGRIMAVESEISLSIHQGTLPWQPTL